MGGCFFFCCNPSKSSTTRHPFSFELFHLSNRVILTPQTRMTELSFAFGLKDLFYFIFFALKTIMSSGKWRIFFTDCRLIWHRPYRPKEDGNRVRLIANLRGILRSQKLLTAHSSTTFLLRSSG